MATDTSQVIPLHNPSVAETISVLAGAMGFEQPPARERRCAGDYPAGSREQEEALALYSRIKERGTRQAILDALVAITVAESP